MPMILKGIKLFWAKNYKIPFRGNLKLFNNKSYIASNQNNTLLYSTKFQKSD